jgi:hypothetical protein
LKEYAMELLDRYLQAVKKHLPWKRQEDIIAELRANLEAQLEDKETELGRPLTTGESEDWLRQIGPPIRVAARYQPAQYVIGPAIFPTYWYVMRLAFLWSVVIYSIVSAIQIATQNPGETGVLEAVLRVPAILMQVAAWVTLIFAAIEFVATRYPAKWPEIAGISEEWTPSSLPPLETDAGADDKPRSYAHAVADVIFGFVFLIWMLLVPRYPYLLMGPGAAYVQGRLLFTPVLIQFYWWLLALNVIGLIWKCVDLVRGDWNGSLRLRHLFSKIFGLIPLGLLINAPDHAYVALKSSEGDRARYGLPMNSLNQAIHWFLMVVLAIALVDLLWDLGRIAVEAYRRRESALG